MNTKEARDFLDVVDKDEAEEEAQERQHEYVRPRAPKDPSQMVSVRIPVRVVEQLRRTAEARDVTPSDLIRESVVEFLAQLQRYEGKTTEENVIELITSIEQSLREVKKLAVEHGFVTQQLLLEDAG